MCGMVGEMESSGVLGEGTGAEGDDPSHQLWLVGVTFFVA